MIGNNITTSIITNGLSCGGGVTACKSGIITTFFSLYCTSIEVPVDVPSPGGGGAYPRDAWNKLNPGQIQDFYKPVDMDQYYILPRDQEVEFFRRNKIVTFKLAIGDTAIEKEYSIPEEKVKAAIAVINIAETTRKNMSIVARAVKTVTTDIVIRVKNVLLKR